MLSLRPVVHEHWRDDEDAALGHDLPVCDLRYECRSHKLGKSGGSCAMQGDGSAPEEEADGEGRASDALSGKLGNVKCPLPSELLPDSIFSSPAAHVWPG